MEWGKGIPRFIVYRPQYTVTCVLVGPGGRKFDVRTGVVSPYVSVPTRLKSSSGHGVDCRTGVDCQSAWSEVSFWDLL